MAKINLEEIRTSAGARGWTLISEEYKNLDTPLEFECSEGHRIHLPYKKVRNKWECPICKKNIFFDCGNAIIPKSKGTIRVLALDQSTHITGFSIYDDKELINYGIYETPDANDEIERDSRIKHWLISMIENWKPDYIGIEGIQYQEKMGVTTFETLARLQGILMETCYSVGIPYKICPTNTWRKEAGVKGRARTDKKRSAQLIIKDLYDIKVTEDEADAILIGRYTSNHYGVKPKVMSWE